MQATSFSPNKKSPRGKKLRGLGAFLSKYNDKEQQEGPNGVFSSSSASYTGSVGSESTGSKKSSTSMPARLPIMFSRSGRSDTQATVTVTGQTQDIGGKTNGSEHTSSTPSSTRQSHLRTSCHTMP